VLIGFAEALSAPEVLWSLVDAGCKVRAFSRKGRNPALRYSRYVTVEEITAPERDADLALSDLQELVGKQAASSSTPCVVLPLDDSALLLAQGLTDRDPCTLAAPHGSPAAVAFDKCLQLEQARAAGFHVLETSTVTTREELTAFSSKLPLILRPAHAARIEEGKFRKGRNWICATEAEFDAAVSEWAESGPLIVQTFIEGNGEGIFGFATGESVVEWSAHRRVRMMNPHGSGSSACASQTVPPDVRDAAERFIRAIEWRGLFMIELLRDAAGKAWFVEFNGRTWGSMALARRHHLEYPAWAVQASIDPDFRPPVAISPNGSQIECRNLGRELMHLLFVLRGSKSRAIRAWPSVGSSLRNVLSWNRGTRLYNWRLDDWKVGLADTLFTIRDQVFKARS
jgi:predicted ATP-grasp superfamily ATP-dependent carboligase